MSINRYRNLKSIYFNYTKKLASLVKIEVSRNRTRKNSGKQELTAPINSSGSLRDSISFELKGSTEKINIPLG